MTSAAGHTSIVDARGERPVYIGEWLGGGEIGPSKHAPPGVPLTPRTPEDANRFWWLVAGNVVFLAFLGLTMLVRLRRGARLP